jgi:hypothetical protein
MRIKNEQKNIRTKNNKLTFSKIHQDSEHLQRRLSYAKK